MIGELIVKCVMLIALIHGLRILARRIGPRASGLILGLPSSTAVLLVLCGREKGSAEAIEMADASLLGLIAAVSLPLAYAHAVRRGWGLPAALAAAVAAYVVVAIGLGYLHPGESVAAAGDLVRLDPRRHVPGLADRHPGGVGAPCGAFATADSPGADDHPSDLRGDRGRRHQLGRPAMGRAGQHVPEHVHGRRGGHAPGGGRGVGEPDRPRCRRPT